MTLIQRITALTNAVGAAIKALRLQVGENSNLTTEAKNTLVAAINEVQQKADGITAVSNRVKTLEDAPDKVGSLSDLTTTEKGTAVGAINEIKSAVSALTAAGNTSINDATASTSTTYSSTKIEQVVTDAVAQAKTDLTDGADAAWDTFKELESAIRGDRTSAAALANSVGNRLRIDEVMNLTSDQKQNVEQTLNLGDTDTDFVAIFNAAVND